ncbi:hypothetical protein [Flavobacterium sp. I3-2]|uniref:hypothetical protein n=1 Tax=Flavobacterium sp. I3-2 TaxID=2748319 RepID=UPI0015AE9CDC|nr:hypothetical protein [Flavobacterium sp. I3-2]
MFSNLLAFHSLFRWLVIILLLITIALFTYKYFTKETFSIKNYRLLQITCWILNVQLVIGILLFSKSQLVYLLWDNFQETVKMRQPRFFGLEHPSMMLLGIILFNYFTFKVRNKINTTKAVTYFLKRFIIILIIILSSIPWSFSPLTNRPNFRDFYLTNL